MEVIASESASDKHGTYDLVFTKQPNDDVYLYDNHVTNAGFLLATPISSNSKLVLIERHESFLSMQRPSDFVSASLFISKVAGLYQERMSPA